MFSAPRLLLEGWIRSIILICLKTINPRFGFQNFEEKLTDVFLTGDITGASKLKGAISYSYMDLKFATKNFSSENKLGVGGFGVVYKVALHSMIFKIMIS